MAISNGARVEILVNFKYSKKSCTFYAKTEKKKRTENLNTEYRYRFNCYSETRIGGHRMAMHRKWNKATFRCDTDGVAV